VPSSIHRLHAACIKDRYGVEPADVTLLKLQADNAGGSFSRGLLGTATFFAAGAAAFVYWAVTFNNKYAETGCAQNPPELVNVCGDYNFGGAGCWAGAGVVGAFAASFGGWGTVERCRAAPLYRTYDTARNAWNARQSELKDLVGAMQTFRLESQLIEFYRALIKKMPSLELDILDIRCHVLLGDENEELCPGGNLKNSAESADWLLHRRPITLADFLALAPRYPAGYPKKFEEHYAFLAAMKPNAQEIHGHEIKLHASEQNVSTLDAGLNALERSIAEKEEKTRDLEGKLLQLDELKKNGLLFSETPVSMDPALVKGDLDQITGELSALRDRANKLRLTLAQERLNVENERAALAASYARFNDAAAKFDPTGKTIPLDEVKAEMPSGAAPGAS